jgi:hypothetical protein
MGGLEGRRGRKGRCARWNRERSRKAEGVSGVRPPPCGVVRTRRRGDITWRLKERKILTSRVSSKRRNPPGVLEDVA